MNDLASGNQDQSTDEFPLNPLRHENNGQLVCYNMYPRNYVKGNHDNAFLNIKDEIPRVARMGFNAVWLNPICSLGQIPKPNKDLIKKHAPLPFPDLSSERKSSAYAMFDPFKINPEFHTSRVPSQDELVRGVREFTKEVRKHGMVPMFDIALSHISSDSPLVTKKSLIVPSLTKSGEPTVVDTSAWVERYDSNAGPLAGKPKMHGVGYSPDKGTHATEEECLVWSDVALFNYNDPKVCEDIINKLWKPYIDYYVDMGFAGLRVDSIAQNLPQVLNPVLKYFKQEVHKKWGIPEDQVVILGETLGAQVSAYKTNDQMTHAYSSVYFSNLQHAARGRIDDECERFWSDPNNWLMQQNGQLQEIVHTDMHGNARSYAKGGAVGYPGSHDQADTIVSRHLKAGYTTHPEEMEKDGHLNAVINLSDYTIRDRFGHIDVTKGDHGKITPENIQDFVDVKAATYAMREQLAQTALIGAGMFMFGEDEYLTLDKRSIFKDHVRGFPVGDVSALVTDINAMLKNLPENSRGSWSRRVFLDHRSDIVIVERHTGSGFGGRADIMIVNCEPDKGIELTREDIEKLANSVRLQDGRRLSVDDVVAAFTCRSEYGVVSKEADKQNIVHMDRTVKLSKELLKDVPTAKVGQVAHAEPALAAGAGRGV